MRTTLITLACLVSPAAAWEFTPDPVCTLMHSAPEAALTITFQPGPLYTLTIALADGEWAASPTFGMAFNGPNPLTIGTDRHAVQGPRLSVSDQGFGNVLDGLEFNQIATAFTQSLAINFPLAGAADPVRQFRACAAALPPTA